MASYPNAEMTQVSFRLSIEDKLALDELAKSQGTTKQALFEELLLGKKHVQARKPWGWHRRLNTNQEELPMTG